MLNFIKTFCVNFLKIAGFIVGFFVVWLLVMLAVGFLLNGRYLLGFTVLLVLAGLCTIVSMIAKHFL